MPTSMHEVIDLQNAMEKQKRRDQFAMAALTALLAYNPAPGPLSLAKEAYCYADAMEKARTEQEKDDG